MQTVERPKEIFAKYEGFLVSLDKWFKTVSSELLPRLDGEPLRLLQMGEHRAAFISAMTLFEGSLRDHLIRKDLMKGSEIHMGLAQMLRATSGSLELSASEMNHIYEWMKLRNLILHENRRISQKIATRSVTEILLLVKKLRG
jgi:hypothetical protein